jgi:hypothetical protein
MLHLPRFLIKDLRRLLRRRKKHERIWLWMRTDGTWEVL